jgi:hypothetical protein
MNKVVFIHFFHIWGEINKRFQHGRGHGAIFLDCGGPGGIIKECDLPSYILPGFVCNYNTLVY